jgi:hypothetical protein
MYRRIFLIAVILISVVGVYNLTRPSNKTPLDAAKEIDTKAVDQLSNSTPTTNQQLQPGDIIPETTDTVAELPLRDKLVMIENEVVNAKTALAATNSPDERIELEIFINAAEDILNTPNFDIDECEKYKADFNLKYHPNIDDPMSEGTEKAYRLLEELCT